MPEPMPGWLRACLIVTTPLNFAGALAFTPFARPLQGPLGYPDAPDLHLWTISTFVGTMGVAYGWMAWTRTVVRPLLALAAAGKAWFAVVLIGCTLAGQTPLHVALSGLPDLALAVAFTAFLVRSRD